MTLSHPFSKLILLAALTALLPTAQLAWAEDETFLEFKAKKCFDVTPTPDGKGFSAVIKPKQKLNASVELPSCDTDGWYALRGEYRTTGMDSVGTFILNLTKIESHSWQPYAAQSDWSPFVHYFKVTETGVVRALSVVGEPDAMRVESNGKIEFRNITMTPYTVTSGEELLGNPDFARGKEGELPALWNWGYHTRPGDYTLISDKTFQSGTQTLQIRSENSEDGRTVQAIKLPFPGPGKLTYTAWVRSNDANMTMILYLFSADYKWLKCSNIPVTDKWSKLTLEVDVPENPTSIYLCPRIDIKGNGAVNIAGASLVWNEKSTAPVVAGNGNLLKNPDMDLGFNGWTFDFFGPGGQPIDSILKRFHAEECHVVPGEGVDGGNALFVPIGACLISHCVPITEGKTYSVSVYLKAREPGTTATMYFIDPGWNIYSQNCTDIPTDRWQRYSLTLKWDKSSKQKKAYIRIEAMKNDGVLVDRAQIEEGPLTSYKSPSVMLGMLAPKNVFAPGEKIEGITAAVVTQPSVPRPTKLEVQVKEALGTVLYKQTLNLTGSPTESIPLNDLPSKRLGVFDVTLKALDGEGKTLAQAESRYAVVDAPACPMLPTGFPLFGIGHEVSSMPIWADLKLVPLNERMGARLNRFFLSNDALPNPKYRELLKEQLKLQTEHGIKTIIANIEPPKALREKISEEDKLSEATLKAWSDFLKEVVTDLKDSIQYWEIINEPNCWTHESGSLKGQRCFKPEKYAAILHTAYDTIKAIDPKLQVVGFSLAASDYDYVRGTLQFGAGKWMDVYTWHAYRDAPDSPSAYDELQKMKALVKEYGFNGPTINGEQYFSANLFPFHNHDEEVRRRYTVGEKDELWATGRILQTFIHQAAAQVSWSIFAPGSNSLKLGMNDPVFLYYVYGGYNAATRILNNAGAGQPVNFSADARAFFFPNASGGPLLALYTTLPEFNAHVKLATPKFTAQDMMGNTIPAESIQKEGLPVQIVPTYVRLPEGTKVEQVQKMLAESPIEGLGDPFGIRVTMMPDGRLGVALTNRMNSPVGGKVALRDYPATWKFKSDNITFPPIPGGTTAIIPFSGEVPIAAMAEYHVTVVASAQDKDKFTRRELRLAPLFAPKTEHPTLGGATTQWTTWVDLGEDNLSKDYNPKLPHTGAEDLSAKLALGWDKEGLTLVVVVTDDKAVFPPAKTVGNFEYDSLQIYFDQKNNAASPEVMYDSDDISYYVALIDGKPIAVLEKGLEGRYLGGGNQTTGIDPDVQTSITRQGNKTTYQIKFPTKCLPSVAFEPGGTMGFSILINDNDGQGRKVGLTLSPKGDQPYIKPYYYRTVIFR